MKYRSLPATASISEELSLFSEMYKAKPEGTMIIAMQSHITGMLHFAELAITKEEVDNFTRGMKVQHAFPNLTDNEREFLLSGITPEEWEGAFPKGEEEED